MAPPQGQVKVVLAGLKAFLEGLASPGHDDLADRVVQDLAVVYSDFSRRRFIRESRGGGEWPPLKSSTIVGRAYAPLRRVQDMIEDGHLTGAAAERAAKRARAKVEKVRRQLDPERETRQLQAQLDKLTREANAAGGSERYRKRIAAMRKKIADKRAHPPKQPKVAILINTGTLLGALSIGAPGNVTEQIVGGLRFGIVAGTHPGGPTIGQIAEAHQEGNARLPQRRILVRPDSGTMAVMKRLLAKAAKDSIKGRGLTTSGDELI